MAQGANCKGCHLHPQSFPGQGPPRGVSGEPHAALHRGFSGRNAPRTFWALAHKAHGVKQLYDQREVSRLTGISESQIRYWDRQGLTPHREKDRAGSGSTSRAWWPFGRKGFAPAGRLAPQDQKLPGQTAADHAGLEKTPPVGGADFPGRRPAYPGQEPPAVYPEGQLFINFNGSESAPVTPAREAFEELFFQALEDEDAGRMSEAREKYSNRSWPRSRTTWTPW